jgi:hypothetical protein
LGGPIEEIRRGDVVWIPPDQKHWHGATAATGMTHIAIQEYLDGMNVDWMEKVTDEQYRAQLPARRNACRSEHSDRAIWKCPPSASAAWG